jgi:formylglycine-generating enzyme required for sulfatase activity
MVPTGKNSCIDKREWAGPNGKPLIGASALPELEELAVDQSAETLCASVGKRVCYREEWVSACSRGERFPYGDEYEPGACNDARWWKTVDEAKVARRDKTELSRLDGSEPSGAHPECTSPSGAMDMVGNVEEWVRCSEAKLGYCLVGGFWTSRGSRSCDSAIVTHAPRWHYYQTGFRCCAGKIR